MVFSALIRHMHIGRQTSVADMDTVTFLFVIILNLAAATYGAIQTNVTFIKKQELLSCHALSTQTIPKTSLGSEATFCTVACIQASTESCTCIGWTNVGGSCNMCLECPGGGSTSSLNANYIVQSTCPSNYQERPGTGYCYRLLESDLQSGADAQTKCANHSSEYPGVSGLASIRDKTTLNWILTFFAAQMAAITDGLWIGLYDTGSDDFAWRDGRPFCPWITNDSSNCGPDNPWVGFPNGINQRPGQESCVTLHQRVWNETDCSEIFQFYCASVQVGGGCPAENTATFPPGHCLLDVPAKPEMRNFTEAGKYCISVGHQYLWPAREKTDVDVVTNALPHHNPYNLWIGLRTDGSGAYYWMDKPNEIGLRRNAFWQTSQPEGGITSQQCVAMSVQDGGKWFEEDCAATKPYICQYKIP